MSRMVGHYEIKDLLGEGGIGQVHAAQDTMLDREVAIKSLRPELVNDKSFVNRFRVEANNLAKLTHPNITTLYSLLPEGGNLYMIMELVRGRTLEAILKERGAPFTSQEALAVIGQAAEGLGYAHSMGVVHRDIKPANLMITDAGLLKIMDFGIARVQGAQRMTRAGTAFGTPEYMSPEQVKGQDVDGRSDLYSLAIVLYEMLTGQVPFAATTDYDLGQMHINTTPERPSRRFSTIEPGVEKALMRALSKKADERFDSMTAFKAALGATASMSDAASIVQSATRFVGALPDALSPGIATVSSAVSTMSMAVSERVDKSTIPFALKGVAVGAGAAIVVAAAIVLLWRPDPPPAPAAAPVQSASGAAQPRDAAGQPCGVSQDSMFYRPCPQGQAVATQPAVPLPNAAAKIPAGQTIPAGGNAKKSPFEAAPEPAIGRSGVAVAAKEAPRTAPPAAPTTPTTVTSTTTTVTPTVAREPVRAAESVAPSQTVQPPADTPSDQAGTQLAAAASQVAAVQPPAEPADVKDAPPPASDATQRQAEAAVAPPRPSPGPQKATEAETIAAYQQRNFGVALQFAEPLARDGCVECQFIMGRLLETGSAGKKDPSVAADWYKKAAEGGLAKARYNLASMYLEGNGVIKDARTAAELFHKAAMQGHGGAQFNLALMYEKGDGISRDIQEALHWYGEAAKSDNAGLAEEAKAAIERLERSNRRRRR